MMCDDENFWGIITKNWHKLAEQINQSMPNAILFNIIQIKSLNFKPRVEMVG